ncbi:hypothetical protein HY091_01060 [Candidatus Kaiserbacteria bacterium]|nr:hypothetical protein [Candidatus Kaiserbacteria bacterium]
MPPRPKHHELLFAFGLATFALGALVLGPYLFAASYERSSLAAAIAAPPPVLDRAAYDARMLALAHIDLASTTLGTSASTTLGIAPLAIASSTPSTSLGASATTSLPLLVATTTATTSVSVEGKLWPRAAAYPKYGALLPFDRIVAYYGNFYSTRMGVLGEYPPEEMLAMLASTTAEWQAADPSTLTVPAIDYIAVIAQGSPGQDGKYRLRMPADQIEKALALAEAASGIVILDVQVGQSTVEDELPILAPYLALPQVHLALDPEFAMRPGERPGTIIGSLDASDINWAATYLAQIVQANNLPPKILLVHRFTEAMVGHPEAILPLPEVQVVVDMDGFGTVSRKISTYTSIVAPEPVEFTGFKLFYKNDIPPRGDLLMTPAQVLSLTPAPVFIQYQ